MSILVILIVAVSLSMDAFSLSLIYGTLNLDKKLEKTLSIIVGVFHFFMPILGLSIGNIIVKHIPMDISLITGLIFIGLGIEMVFSIKKEEEIKELNGLIHLFFFALAVSIDSFLVGINLGINKTNIILASTTFMIVSGIFTYIGLKIGKRITNLIGNISIILGGIILIILGLFYLK